MEHGTNKPIKGILLDLDGVVWRGERVVPKASETIALLKQKGFAVRFVSNNSTLGSANLRRRFQTLGIPAEDGDIVLATEVLARRLSQRQSRATVYLIGSEGFRDDLQAQGLRVIDQPEEIDYLTDFVVVGGDPDINYEKLTRALRCLHKGALLAAPNQDASYPAEDGFLPGAGALVAAVETMARHPVDIMIGKPRPDLLNAAVEHAGLTAETCIMVGDTLETDAAAAHAAGIRSVVVLTGNTTKSQAQAADPAPWRVVSSIADLPDVVL